MPVNLHPQVEHDPLPGELHHPRLQILGREGGDEDAQIQGAEAIEAGELAGGDVAVDGDLDQIRLRQRGGRTGKNRDQRHGHFPPVGTEIVQQAPHEARVVGFAKDFVVVQCHDAASSSSSNCFLCNSAYSPPRPTSSSWAPRSTMRPWSSTKI